MYNLVPATKIKPAIGLKQELGSCLMVAALMRWTVEGLWRSDLANSAVNFTLNGSEGLDCGEGLELRAFSGQGAKIGHEGWSWGSGGGLDEKRGHGNEEDAEKRQSKLIYRVKYSQAGHLQGQSIRDFLIQIS